MSAELTELTGFLHDSNPQVRTVAAQSLVGYSVSTNPSVSIFKINDSRPIKDLKILIHDNPTSAHSAMTALINLTSDAEVRRVCLDPKFLEGLVSIITNVEHGLADLACMLLSNLAKADEIVMLLKVKVTPDEIISKSPNAMDQLMDCFVKGSSKQFNKNANYDFLSHVFADLTRFVEGRGYFLTKQEYDDVLPISKFIVFTEHGSSLRRTGIAATIKNCCFDLGSHATLLDEAQTNLLPYILLPLMGPEELSEEDMDGMPDDLQLLASDKTREPDPYILKTHCESLLLLSSTTSSREFLRKRKVYPIIRELHKAVNDEDVRAACDKLVQVLMREEHPQNSTDESEVFRNLDKQQTNGTNDLEDDIDDEDDKIVEVL